MVDSGGRGVWGGHDQICHGTATHSDQLKGYCTHNQVSACFALYLKLIKTWTPAMRRFAHYALFSHDILFRFLDFSFFKSILMPHQSFQVKEES